MIMIILGCTSIHANTLEWTKNKEMSICTKTTMGSMWTVMSLFPNIDYFISNIKNRSRPIRML